jgi:hypothetical protein
VAEEEVRADPVEVFRLRCHSRAKLWHDGEIDLHSAVDELQHAAEASGLIDAIGQDAAHGLMAAAVDRLWEIATAHALVRALGEDRVQAIIEEAFASAVFRPKHPEVV